MAQVLERAQEMLDPAEIMPTVRTRRAPMTSASAGLRL